jgi:hypothetical protein
MKRLFDWMNGLDAADQITVLYVIFFVCLFIAGWKW